jgi:hypothetical protein
MSLRWYDRRSVVLSEREIGANAGYRSLGQSRRRGPPFRVKQGSRLTRRDACNPSNAGAGPPPGALLRFLSSSCVRVGAGCDECRSAWATLSHPPPSSVTPTDYGRAPRIRLNGLTVARRTRLNPPCLSTSVTRASPACAPNARLTSWASDAGDSARDAVGDIHRNHRCVGLACHARKERQSR